MQQWCQECADQCLPCKRRDDIRIVRNAEGKQCRLGEGGFGVVYKALMNGVDEVAVKLVKADTPSPQEMAAFRKEVSPPSLLWPVSLSFLFHPHCLAASLQTRLQSALQLLFVPARLQEPL